MQHDSTVNPEEVAFYEGLAAFWWDRTGPFWPLHRLNELRVAWIRERLCDHFGRPAASDRPLEGLRVLDIGCGGGILSESMAALGAEVCGIDVVEKNIGTARAHARQQGAVIDYQARTAESLAESGAQFDVVLNMEVVEHVADVAAFMASCNRLVREGGVMFVATINRTALAWLFAIVGAEYILRWLPRGTHRWRDFRKPGEIQRLLGDGGLRVVGRSGVAINPWTRSFGLVPRLNVNYMLMAVRERG
ncbi:MAG: bifunctional 2-polyprenyl-6-hydroxyphenol methylase/3-demethylubiquinol 3-O-methyltransferase UbiG [Xanthomonadales bacterium]|nr:bifunctional 2-polyprenyl-6-hydroxyphenol methylase/3-demethylubiquinol 3-O-methyltransferase UbiG [Xanthomonadales bacterium]